MRRAPVALIPIFMLLSLYGGDLYLALYAKQPDCAVSFHSSCCQSAEAGAPGAATCCDTRCPKASNHSFSVQLALSKLLSVPPPVGAEMVTLRPTLFRTEQPLSGFSSDYPLYLRLSVLLI